MSKFNIGDKVRVRKDLVACEFYGGYQFLENMEKYRGKEFVIEEYDDFTGYILRNTDESVFTDEMLEDKESEENNMNTMPKLETGMFVIVEDNTEPYKRNIGVVINDKIVYSNGDFDPADYTTWDTQYIRYILKCNYGFNFIKYKIDEIYNNDSFACYGIKIIWKYEEPILKVTMDDIYKKFGCKVKIVPETT